MATEKQQLLSQLSGYDTSVLSRLVKYASYIIIPEEDLLVNVNMSQMMDKVHSLADVHFPEWTDRSKADFGEFIAELLALFSEKDFWYLNAFANEGYLQRISVYSNGYVRAVELGHMPQLFRSARCKVRVLFAPSGETHYIEPGRIAITGTGLPYEFSNSERVVVPASVTQQAFTIEFAEGVYDKIEENFNGKSVRVLQNKVDLSSLVATIAGVEWEQKISLSKSSSTDKHYLPLPEEDASAEIFFGDGENGVQPPLSERIEVLYRIGGGSAANGIVAGTMNTVVENTTGRTILSVSQLTPTSGGAEQETLSQIKNNTPLIFRTQSRVINATDLEDVVGSRNDVARVKAITFSNNFYFYVVKSDGSKADQAFLDTIKNSLSVLMGFNVFGFPTEYIQAGPLSMTVYALRGFDPIEIESETRDLLKDYTDPLADAQYGRGFELDDVVREIIASVAGVQNVVFNSVQGGVPHSVEIGSNQMLELLQDSDITINVVTA
jgi:hypothetical protein